MAHKRSFSSTLFFLSAITLSFTTVQSYYFSNYEVFKIIKKNDSIGFDQWMRTYPNVNIFNKYGQTPLMIAAKNHNDYFIQSLINSGARKHYIDDFGYTAIDYAKSVDTLHTKSSQAHSSYTNSTLAALGVGIAAGILTYGICELLSDSDASISYTYSSPDYYVDNYCTKCDRYIRYTKDRDKLYCNNCYNDYCNRHYR